MAVKILELELIRALDVHNRGLGGGDALNVGRGAKKLYIHLK